MFEQYALTPFGIAAISTAIGAVAGSLATLLWEAAVKPKVIARAVAEVLSIEIGRNGQGLLLDRVQRRQDPTSVPVRSPVHTEVYRVVLPQLGEIPPPLLGQLIHLYGLFSLVNDLAVRANELRDRMLYALGDKGISPHVKEELNRTLGMYMSATDAAVNMIVLIQEKVVAIAFPWWSARRWFGPRPVSFSEAEIADKFKSHKTEVESLIAHVERAAERL